MFSEHLGYLRSIQRSALLERAVTEAVQPGDRVLDLGCGVGILGLFALRAGAAHVTAVDGTRVTEVAEELFSREGFSDRVTVRRGWTNQMEFDEQFDLIICDHIGYFALDYMALGVLRDARKRLLKPGGRLLPQRVQLHVAPVAEDTHLREAFGFAAPEVPEAFHWLTQYTTNVKYGVNFRPEKVLAAAQKVDEIDFLTEERFYFSCKIEFEIKRRETLYGIAGWFGCDLSDNVRMTNSPLDLERIDRQQAFFPIAEPIPVEIGDRLKVAMGMRPNENDFAWTVEHQPSGRRFRQASMKGEVLNIEKILRGQRDRIPRLKPSTKARLVVLGYCDGKRSVDQIVAAVKQDRPDLFPTEFAIEDFVLETLGEHAE